jgi:lipopolysaccharide transport system ATP-binding protein
MNETLIKVENVSKKFCRDLKRSLWYGIKDLGTELLGKPLNHDWNLRKDEFWAVRDVSFDLKRGDFLGLIGCNGAGKTTLLRMLNGLIKPDKGLIKIHGRVGALIALGAGFNPILTGRENIYVNAAVLGLSKKETDLRFDSIVEFAEIGDFIDAPIQSYSSGMAVRLGFAVTTALSPDILLLDEVLAVGDEGFQKKCFNRMGELIKKGVAIIFVSHNMHAIATFSNKVIVMKGGVHKEHENISEGIREYREQFINNNHENVDKFCSGNDLIKFHNVEIEKKELLPGDSFNARLLYKTKEDYMDVEVDIVIRSYREISLYFQATNKAHKKVINLKKEHSSLNIKIKDIRINDANGDINIAVWAHHRVELLFWCKIPVEFLGADHATGSTFLDVAYDIS